MDAQIRHCLTSLQSRHMKGIFAKNFEEGCQKILDLIPAGAVVGIGDATGIKQLGILQMLKDQGTKVLNPFETQGNTLGTINRMLNYQKRLNHIDKVAFVTVCRD